MSELKNKQESDSESTKSKSLKALKIMLSHHKKGCVSDEEFLGSMEFYVKG